MLLHYNSACVVATDQFLYLGPETFNYKFLLPSFPAGLLVPTVHCRILTAAASLSLQVADVRRRQQSPGEDRGHREEQRES